MKIIPTRVHGVLDYVSGAALALLPRIFGWGPNVTLLLTIMAITLLVASLATRYELSLFKLIPMVGHLALDAFAGVALIAAAFLFQNEGAYVLPILLVMGLLELGAAFMTETTPRTLAGRTS